MRYKLGLGIALLVLTQCSGCLVPYLSHTRTVTVLDAETGHPIPAAEVSVGYIHMFILNPPKNREAITDENGQCQIRVVCSSFLGILSCSRQGFWKGNSSNVSLAASQKSSTLYLYQGEPPELTIWLPDNYRGFVKLERVDSGLQAQPGRRKFAAEIESDGFVRVDSKQIADFDNFEFEPVFRYKNGNQIPSSPLVNDKVGWKWILSNGKRSLYLVGTSVDEETIHPHIYEYHDGDPRHISNDYEFFKELFDRRIAFDLDEHAR